ncbi:MAG: M23 family metallopeptidase [Leptospiraceae bacterium]|nr:M23 family metallopeptidase [Leptospiraceae bacterium]
MNYKSFRSILCFALITLPSLVMPIDSEKKAKVGWPMLLKVPISGSFAEFRNSHLHMGCDFKTYGINGLPVLSIFDGYISHISFSDSGYGLTVLSSSPNLGLTSRHAHLHDLYGDISGLFELHHSLRLLGSEKGYSVKLKPDLFSLKKGQKIARSGDTGSGVPHLHLEISETNFHINPLTFPAYSHNDTTPPTIQSVFIDSDSGYSKRINVITEENSKPKLDTKEEIKLTGKVKLKVGGYDFMTSRNKNNVYGITLKVDNKIIYQKFLDKMSYKDAINKDLLYDTNKSSLSPPLYVYNLFNSEKTSFSFDLTSEPNGEEKKISVILSDVSGNDSILSFSLQTDHSQRKVNPNSSAREFQSSDGKLSINFSKAKIIGEGFVTIKQLSEIPPGLTSPEFPNMSAIYEIEAFDFGWKGEVRGFLKGNFPDKEDNIYVYDLNFKEWLFLNGAKSSNGISFSLNRLGYIAVMKDKTPPKINFPYLVYRNFHLPEIQNPKMLERFYAVSDRGTGTSSILVQLEGQPYPFRFDKDRGYIILEVPLSLKLFKKYYVIQIKTKDRAGNESEWFTDIISL